jgi:transposase
MSFEQNFQKEKKRRFALSMYLEGLGFHSIGRHLGVSHVCVLNWIRKYGSQLVKIRNPRPAKIIELDEMHSYVGHKKTTDGYGLVLIEKPASTWISLLETEVQKQV